MHYFSYDILPTVNEDSLQEYNGAVVGMQQCRVRAALAALQATQEKLGLGGGLRALSSAAL